MTIIIRNADIYTSDVNNPKADTIVLDGKTITYVGNESGAEKFCTAASESYDAKGRFIMPGIIDSHIHPGWITKKPVARTSSMDRKCR